MRREARRRINRFMSNPWTGRAALLVAIAVNVPTLLDPAQPWVRPVVGAIMCVLIAVNVVIELRRRETARLNAADPHHDPVRSAALNDYMAGLTTREQMQVIDWIAHKYDRSPDDRPPHVRDYFAIAEAHEEADRG